MIRPVPSTRTIRFIARLHGQALAGRHVVVTLEKPAGTPSKKKIKVPNACAGVDVKCITLFSMMQILRVKLVLESSAPQSA